MSGVLTNKQKWRRQSAKIRRETTDYLYQQGVTSETSSSSSRSLSVPTIKSLGLTQLGPNWATTGTLADTNEQTIRSRKIRFSSAVHVVLIPTVDEYRNAELGDLMWWDADDYKSFKFSALSELQAALEENRNLTSKEVIDLMYQPNGNRKYTENRNVPILNESLSDDVYDSENSEAVRLKKSSSFDFEKITNTKITVLLPPNSKNKTNEDIDKLPCSPRHLTQVMNSLINYRDSPNKEYPRKTNVPQTQTVLTQIMPKLDTLIYGQ